jgi:hypothetical protein
MPNLPMPGGPASAQLTPDLVFAKLRLFQKRRSPKKLYGRLQILLPPLSATHSGG